MIKLGRVSMLTRGLVVPGYWEDIVEFNDGERIKKPGA
jgi:hypothetical protein